MPSASRSSTTTTDEVVDGERLLVLLVEAPDRILDDPRHRLGTGGIAHGAHLVFGHVCSVGFGAWRGRAILADVQTSDSARLLTNTFRCGAAVAQAA